MKRKDFTEFSRLCADLERDLQAAFEKQYAILLSREDSATPEQRKQIDHQEATLASLTTLKAAFFQSLLFFADRELYAGIQLVDRVMAILHQMMQVCDNSVALIFIGLIKTGRPRQHVDCLS